MYNDLYINIHQKKLEQNNSEIDIHERYEVKLIYRISAMKIYYQVIVHRYNQKQQIILFNFTFVDVINYFILTADIIYLYQLIHICIYLNLYDH
jgi:hypothetical protein